MKKKIRHNEAGLTLVELMVTAAVITIGLVAAMQSILSLARHSEVIEARLASMEFTHSILEDMRGRPIEDLLSFEPNLPILKSTTQDPLAGTTTVTDTLIIPGWGRVAPGEVEIYIDALTPNGEFHIFPDPGDPNKVPNFPNPLPITIEMQIYGPFGDRPVKFRTSTLVVYQ